MPVTIACSLHGTRLAIPKVANDGDALGVRGMQAEGYREEGGRVVPPRMIDVLNSRFVIGG